LTDKRGRRKVGKRERETCLPWRSSKRKLKGERNESWGRRARKGEDGRLLTPLISKSSIAGRTDKRQEREAILKCVASEWARTKECALSLDLREKRGEARDA